MTTAAPIARAEAPAVPTRPRARTRPARGLPRRRLAGGAAWIAAVAALLAGVVALNVAVLRLNLQLEQLGAERVRLRAEIAELESRVAGAASDAQIRAEARRRGFRAVNPAATRFVAIGPRAR
ncbi:MAG: hypothetical protein ICV59_01750 [Thermoleophilia bacterium]|nr:hypothetical protein [Thermoleophilia bacterium]